MSNIKRKSFLRRLFCIHSYVFIKAERVNLKWQGRVYNDYKIVTYQCEKCGNFKQVKLK